MFYIFNKSGQFVASSDVVPNLEDCASRGEQVVESDQVIIQPKLIDGQVVCMKDRPSIYHTWKNGTWHISSDDLIKLKADELSQARSNKLTQINSHAQAYINQKAGLNDIPDFEVQTWTIQALEAKAWHEDNSTPTPTLETIAAARGVPVDILRQKAYKKAIKFEKLSAYVAGVRQRLTDLVDKAVSVDELNQVVIEFALSENTKQ